MGDLSLVDLQDLIDEIHKRHDASVICLLKTPDKDFESTDFHYRGGKFTCMGLAKTISNKILIDIEQGRVED